MQALSFLADVSSPSLRGVFHQAAGCEGCGSSSPAVFFCLTCSQDGKPCVVACNHCAGLSAKKASPSPSRSPSPSPSHRGHSLVRIRRAAYADCILLSDALKASLEESNCIGRNDKEGSLLSSSTSPLSPSPPPTPMSSAFWSPSPSPPPQLQPSFLSSSSFSSPAATAAESASRALLVGCVQPYRINGLRVVMLRARSPPTASPPSGNCCVACGSGAADGFSLCSLQCLVSALGSGKIALPLDGASAVAATAAAAAAAVASPATPMREGVRSLLLRRGSIVVSDKVKEQTLPGSSSSASSSSYSSFAAAFSARDSKGLSAVDDLFSAPPLARSDMLDAVDAADAIVSKRLRCEIKYDVVCAQLAKKMRHFARSSTSLRPLPTTTAADSPVLNGPSLSWANASRRLKDKKQSLPFRAPLE